MAKKKDKFKIEIRDNMYYENLIWMSYRYCIGRKSIAAHSHAGDIASNSYGHFSEDRERFMAHDIRREINSIMNFSRHAQVHDYRDHIPQDAMTTILYRIKENTGVIPLSGFLLIFVLKSREKKSILTNMMGKKKNIIISRVNMKTLYLGLSWLTLWTGPVIERWLWNMREKQKNMNAFLFLM